MNFCITQSPYLHSPLCRLVLHVLYEAETTSGPDHHLIDTQLPFWSIVLMEGFLQGIKEGTDLVQLVFNPPISSSRLASLVVYKMQTAAMLSEPFSRHN